MCYPPLPWEENIQITLSQVTIDGKEYKACEHLIYNGIMINEVPNMAFIIGYTNASWTLKADVASLFFTKLLNYMRDNNVAKVCGKYVKIRLIVRIPKVKLYVEVDLSGYSLESSCFLGCFSGLFLATFYPIELGPELQYF